MVEVARALSIFAAALFAAPLLAACGEDADNWDEGRPLIRKLTYLQQKPDKPFQLEFALEFEDTDGDLGTGTLHLYSNGEEKDQSPLSDLFADQGIEPGAVLGELEVTATIDSSIVEGERVELGFVLEDAAGNESNDPTVVLQALPPGG